MTVIIFWSGQNVNMQDFLSIAGIMIETHSALQKQCYKFFFCAFKCQHVSVLTQDQYGIKVGKTVIVQSGLIKKKKKMQIGFRKIQCTRERE